MANSKIDQTTVKLKLVIWMFVEAFVEIISKLFKVVGDNEPGTNRRVPVIKGFKI